jgi:hypothetical protein
MGQSKWLIILVTAVITAVVIGGGVYLWQNKEIQPAPTQQLEKKQEVRSLADCSKLGSSWTLFSNSGTSLSFCYKAPWGNPQLKEEAVDPKVGIGSTWFLTFPTAPSPMLGNQYPLISYQTLDYQLLGDTDAPPFSAWVSMDFNKSNSELARLFPDSQNATALKFTVNSRQVLKAKRDFVEPLSQERITPLDYFMPNVVIDGTSYNLHIIGALEQEADLDKLLNSMVF